MHLQKLIVTLVTGSLILSAAAMVYAQQHEHQQTGIQPAVSAAAPASAPEEEAIFCPTMKTGQLCSHGTAAILQLKGEEADAWITLARKYNKAVDAATLQLFKDAEHSLSPKQMQLLKAWFAIGLNPQINELLYAKGLGPKKETATKTGSASGGGDAKK